MVAIRVTADLAALKKLGDQLGNTSDLLLTISKNLSEEAIDLVKEGWRNQADPYGKAWRATKSSDGNAILVRTGAMRGSVHRQYTARGFEVSIQQFYSQFHQTGTRHMPRRAMLPYKGLPAKWKGEFDDIASDILRDHFR